MTRSDTPSDQDILSAMMDGEWRADDVRGALVDVCRDDARRARWGRYHLARDAMHAEAIDVRGSVAASVSAAIAAEPTYSNVSAIGGAAERTVVDTDEAGTTDKADMTDVTDQAVAARAGSTVPAATPARGGTLRTFAAGFGLAASVAVVTTVGLNAWQASDEGAGTTVAAAPAAPSTPAAPAASAAPPAPIVPSVLTATADPFSQQLPGISLPAVELVANAGAFWSAPGPSGQRVASEDRLNMFLSRHIESSPTAERQGMLPYSRLVGYDERVPRER